ncbi:MAG TPA: nuclear transport factor 2 family protein [Pyrinomonadaceae bacterium]|nr:nuclear transport factor 2 family protein [Pyrinomonadaceae bacterium]
MTDQTDQKGVPNIQVEQELRRMNEAWVKALIQGDTATLDRIMANDFIFTYPFEGDDKAQTLEDVRSGDLRVEYLNRENVRVRVYGNTAVLTGRDTTKWQYKGREFTGQYRIIHVYAERQGRWQLVAVQACPMTQQ